MHANIYVYDVRRHMYIRAHFLIVYQILMYMEIIVVCMLLIGVAKPGHTWASSPIFAPTSASYLDFLIITKSCTFILILYSIYVL